MEAESAETVREALRKKNLTVEQVLEIPSANDDPAIGFTEKMPWTLIDDKTKDADTKTATQLEKQKMYAPLIDTLRLFAGWLLAWYGAVYVLGAYQQEQVLSSDIPFLQALFQSPLILRFTFGTFLFLLLSSLHQWMGRGIGKGIFLTIVGVVLFVLFHLNA